MAKTDPVLDRIAARFPRLAVSKARGGYILADPRSERPVARLRPIPKSDGFELVYWSAARDAWRSFGPLGPMEVSLDELQDIVEHEPLFRLPKRGWLSWIFP